MKILLTGSTVYIAQRLLPILLNNGNEVICCVRDRARFDSEKYRSPSLSVIEVDFLKPENIIVFWRTLPLETIIPKILILMSIGIIMTLASIHLFKKRIMKLS